MTRGTRFALLGAALAVVIVAIVITASGGDDNDDKANQASTSATGTTTQNTQPPKPQVTKIQVVKAKPVGGITKIKANKGDRVRFTVTSDTADEVHVHGYDFMKDVEAGGTVSFNFPANIAGSFEVELEDHEEQIASLKVQP
jgi:hypothetical protein